MTTQYFFIQKFILCVTKSFCIKILVQSCTSLQYIAYSTNSFSCNQILQSASNWLNKIFGKPKNLVPLSLPSPLLNPLSLPSTPYQPLWSADRIPLLWSDPHNTMAGLATRGLHSRQPTKIWLFADFHSKIYIFHRAFLEILRIFCLATINKWTRIHILLSSINGLVRPEFFFSDKF